MSAKELERLRREVARLVNRYVPMRETPDWLVDFMEGRWPRRDRRERGR